MNMKKQTLIIAYAFIMCCLFGQTMTTYTLCEGNFQTPNASLWSINSAGNLDGPIHWDENSNPLGDTGQSLTIHDNKLFIVMNNSHTIEVMNLAGGAQYSTTINLPSASPRYMFAEGDKGYVTSWALNAILILNLNTMEAVDTIEVNGMPEHIIDYQDYLYVSVPSKSDWTTNDKVLKINKADYSIDSTFTVEPGPKMMALGDSSLYITSSSYDGDWNGYAGITSINLFNDEVLRYNAGQTSSYGTDIFKYQNKIYHLFDGGVVPLNNDLTPNTTAKIGNFSSLRSASAYGEHLYFGISDYVAPDTVMVINGSGELMNDYIVGALPGSFAFYNYTQTSIENESIIPEYASMKNFPNPFNPHTSIQYTLKKTSPYRLYISNINGRTIKEFEIQDYTSGTKNIYWYASLFSSVIYFAILKQANQTSVLKLSLIK